MHIVFTCEQSIALFYSEFSATPTLFGSQAAVPGRVYILSEFIVSAMPPDRRAVCWLCVGADGLLLSPPRNTTILTNINGAAASPYIHGQDACWQSYTRLQTGSSINMKRSMATTNLSEFIGI